MNLLASAFPGCKVIGVASSSGATEFASPRRSSKRKTQPDLEAGLFHPSPSIGSATVMMSPWRNPSSSGILASNPHSARTWNGLNATGCASCLARRRSSRAWQEDVRMFASMT